MQTIKHQVILQNLQGDTHTQTLVADAHAELDAIETVMFRNYDVMTDLAGNQGSIPLIDGLSLDMMPPLFLRNA